ncbi:MAG: EI24 domain-containing protein [Aquabacterium sp.]|nr:MAG: EI24 domain-containing protein [Aquabacterium sp.]
MKLVLDALWRALAYCWLPRMMFLTLLPLLVCACAAGALGYFYWEGAVAGVQAWLDGWGWLKTIFGWFGLDGAPHLLAPLVVVILAIPPVIVSSLLVVAAWLTPAAAALVRERRFPGLAVRADEPWVMGVLRSAGLTLAAFAALALSLPLWLIPPFAAVVPPLIWGWLTYRVMAADVLGGTASRDERRRLMKEHRTPLMMLGVITGYLGAAPSLLWAFGVLSLPLAPLLLVVSVWLYTLIFAFSSLWFAHYALAALAVLRGASVQEAIAGDGLQPSIPSSTAPALPPGAQP